MGGTTYRMVLDGVDMEKGDGQLVRDVMTRNVLTVSPDTSAYRAAFLMAERGVGSCVVMRDDKLVGIVTERDLVRRVLAKGLPAKRTRIDRVMSSPVIVVGEGATLDEAIDIMADQNVKRLVVVGDAGVVGVVSVTDLMRVMGRTGTYLRGLPRVFIGRESET
ncbi:MAG: CBS domain-containing protein [Nitrososphaerota archaeon]